VQPFVLGHVALALQSFHFVRARPTERAGSASGIISNPAATGTLDRLILGGLADIGWEPRVSSLLAPLVSDRLTWHKTSRLIDALRLALFDLLDAHLVFVVWAVEAYLDARWELL
jgi:hypothetical protein